MTNPSMTFGRPARLSTPHASVWLGTVAAALIHQLQRWDAWLLGSRQQQPQTAEEVLAWADRIEANEPGFAADLRAAVLRSQDAGAV